MLNRAESDVKKIRCCIAASDLPHRFRAGGRAFCHTVEALAGAPPIAELECGMDVR
ncbi:hypothetical protein [Zeimonas arvi]|uniref:hypothetical protein n=1 Tax=Zeimonas arvi TaxID=2498847 RepID=UPI00165097A8|nr:hypothetical protein [Zeimonas arvi]